MRSHLNLEHKTFLGGKLPSCASTHSAVQGIWSDCCQYCCCSTDSSNGNSTELSLGLSSVPSLLVSLCPQHRVEFYRDYVFKYFSVHQELWGIYCLYWGASELQGVIPSYTQAAPWDAWRMPTFFFPLLFSCQPSCSAPGKLAVPRRGGHVRSTRSFLSQHGSFGVT